MNTPIKKDSGTCSRNFRSSIPVTFVGEYPPPGVNREVSNGLNWNIFIVHCQKCSLILNFKKFQLIFTDFWLLKNHQNVKISSHVLKTLSLYRQNMLISENISKICKCKAKATSTTTFIINFNRRYI